MDKIFRHILRSRLLNESLKTLLGLYTCRILILLRVLHWYGSQCYTKAGNKKPTGNIWTQDKI